MLRLTLGLPPSTNHLYRVVVRQGKGGRYLGRALATEVLTFRQEVAVAIQQARAAGQPTAFPRHRPLAVRVVAYMPNLRRDLDNVLKGLLDALAPQLGIDDAWVVELVARKRIDPAHPRCEVELEEIE